MHLLRGNVSGAVIARHRLSAALVCGVRGAGARQVLFRGLHDALAPLVAPVHAVPVFSHLCVCFFFSGCTVSFSGCHEWMN